MAAFRERCLTAAFDLSRAAPLTVRLNNRFFHRTTKGKYPFEGTLLELVSKIATKEVTYPPHIADNVQLVDLFERIFKKSPIERITIGEIKRHCWIRSLPGQARNQFDLRLNSHAEEFDVLLKPRTKYDDFYRSMSMIPYLHQMYYPIHDNLNVIQLNENEIDEFENLKKIPIVRSNRRKEFNSENEPTNGREEAAPEGKARKKRLRKGRAANFDSRILKIVSSNLSNVESKTTNQSKISSKTHP